MLEDKTANNVVKRYHRIITGDQNQIELGIIPEGKISITEYGSDIDVAQYAKADFAVYPKIIANSKTGLAGFTNEQIKAIAKTIGKCVKVEMVCSIGGVPTGFITYDRPLGNSGGNSGTTFITTAAATASEAGTFTFCFEFDETDPENPLYSANLVYGAALIGGTWTDVKSLASVSTFSVFEVPIVES